MEKDNFHFAGFWIRVVYNILDGFIISFGLIFIALAVLGVVALVAFLVTGASASAPAIEDVTNSPGLLAMLPGLVSIFVVPLIKWPYFALQYASRHQATFGMRVVGVKICNYEYQRLSFWHATGRYFATLFSYITLYVGFLMAAFTRRKQTLHDMIAKTYVVYKN